jgi:hypothetical protein
VSSASGSFFGQAGKIQHDRIALQLHPGHPLDPAHDLAAELVGLALAGRQEDLVARLFARQHALRDLGQRLAREIPCRADLAALEDLARALVAVVPPVFLIGEVAGVEIVEQGLPLLGAEEILALVGPFGLRLLVVAPGDLRLRSPSRPVLSNLRMRAARSIWRIMKSTRFMSPSVNGSLSSSRAMRASSRSSTTAIGASSSQPSRLFHAASACRI